MADLQNIFKKIIPAANQIAASDIQKKLTDLIENPGDTSPLVHAETIGRFFKSSEVSALAPEQKQELAKQAAAFLKETPHTRTALRGLVGMYNADIKDKFLQKTVIETLKSIDQKNRAELKDYSPEAKEKRQVSENIYMFTTLRLAEDFPEDALNILINHSYRPSTPESIAKIARHWAKEKPEIVEKAVNTLSRIHREMNAGDHPQKSQVLENIEHQTAKLYRRLVKNPDFSASLDKTGSLMINALADMQGGAARLTYLLKKGENTPNQPADHLEIIRQALDKINTEIAATPVERGEELQKPSAAPEFLPSH
ncbi:MAG: hypothetical protein IT559_03415 [Alphaproteobacteria bacterium]|nr:hypothetical protein [Alphaproteobacteria bacterium]